MSNFNLEFTQPNFLQDLDQQMLGNMNVVLPPIVMDNSVVHTDENTESNVPVPEIEVDNINQVVVLPEQQAFEQVPEQQVFTQVPEQQVFTQVPEQIRLPQSQPQVQPDLITLPPPIMVTNKPVIKIKTTPPKQPQNTEFVLPPTPKISIGPSGIYQLTIPNQQ